MQRHQTSASDSEAAYDLYDTQGRRVGTDIDYFGPSDYLDERRRPVASRLRHINGTESEWVIGGPTTKRARLVVDPETNEATLAPRPPRRLYLTEILVGAVAGGIAGAIVERLA